MFTSFNSDFEIGETDPIRKFLLLVLAMAHLDRATTLIIGASQSNESGTGVRYQVNGDWSDFPPYPAPIRMVATELEGMAGLSESVREGVLERTVDGVKMRWRVQVTTPGTEYMLARVAD